MSTQRTSFIRTWLSSACCYQYLVSIVALIVGCQLGYAQPNSDSGTSSREDFEQYRMKVWVMADSSPEVRRTLGESFGASLERSLAALFGGAAKLQVEAAPSELADLPANAPPDVETLTGMLDDLERWNKLVILRIGWANESYIVQASQFDVRVQKWNVSAAHPVIPAAAIEAVASRSIAQTFAPIGTLAKPRKDEVDVRLFAGIYAPTDDVGGSPITMQDGALMQVVIRRRRRGGDVASSQPYTYSVVPWTVLQVQESRLGVATCKIHSGLRSPLRVRGVSRTDRIAIGMRPQFDSTVLKLHATDQPDMPLAGYQVYARKVDAKSIEFVGQTNWQGSITLKRDAAVPLKMYYVKHGSLLLSRLPIVAGHERELSVGVTEDSQRLQAEGAVKGIQDRLVDTIAKRQIIAARIRRELEVSDLRIEAVERAKEQLTRLRELPGRNELIREIQDRQRDFFSGDKRTQSRIDRLFKNGRDAVTDALTPALEQALAEQVREAESRVSQLQPSPE